MRITDIQETKGKKYRVFGDGQYLFSLYGKELRQFNLEQNTVISEELIVFILDTIIYKRAKERALFLLERKPLSIHMMRNKLRENDYPQEIIDKVIVFLETYQYLNDEEYVRMYVSSYSDRKSKKQLSQDLYRKGISRDIMEGYFETVNYSEEKCFLRQFERYVRGKNLTDYVTRQKVFRYFYGKGFSIDLIEKCIRDVEFQ